MIPAVVDPPRTYYDVLGVSRDAGPEAIFEAYRAREAEGHGSAQAEEIATAYCVLGNTESRWRYDQNLAAGVTSQSPRSRNWFARHPIGTTVGCLILVGLLILGLPVLFLFLYCLALLWGFIVVVLE